MKNLIIKNKVLIILFIVLLIILSSKILSRKFGNLDEIWNYNISRNIAEGKVPYKDISMVQLPGMFMLTSIFLKLSNELIVTRILGSLLCTIIMITAYKILENLKLNKYISAFIVGIFTYIFFNFFYLDYNFLNLLLILILMLLENKHFEESNNKTNFIIGIIAGCSFLVKQTTGGLVILSAILLKLFQIKKENRKYVIKEIAIRVLGIIAPILMLILYLIIKGALKDFIDYAILGMFTFGNKIPYVNLIIDEVWYIKTLSILVPAYLVGITIYSVVKRDKSLVFSLYGLASFIVVYPISDNVHFLIGALPALIGIVYFIYYAINKMLEEYREEKIIKFAKDTIRDVFYIASILLVIILGSSLIRTTNNIKKYTELKHFKYIPVSETIFNMINTVDNYILQSDKQVYILDAGSAAFTIPINSYSKDFDMFLKGNIGKNGEQGQIEKIKKMKNSYFLIMHIKENRNWQIPTEVLDYVEQNFTKIGSISIYDIYINDIDNLN